MKSKKILALAITLIMILQLSSCGTPIEKKEDGTIVEVVNEKKYSDMSFAEKAEYMAAQTIKTANNPRVLEGIAPAQDKESGEWGYIYSDGTWVIKPQFAMAYSYQEDLAPVLDSYSDFVYIDRKGEQVVGNVNKIAINGCAHFSCGLAAVKLDTGYLQTMAYTNDQGKTEFDADSNFPAVKGVKYEGRRFFMVATPFKNGKACVMRRTNASIGSDEVKECAYVIDTSGDIIAMLPDGLDVDPVGFDDNMMLIVSSHGLYGLCDQDGKLVMQCQWRRISHCEGDTYLVVDDNGFFRYVNSYGVVQNPDTYLDAMPYSEGRAAVMKNEQWCFIGTNGVTATNDTYDEVYPLKIPYVDSSIGKGAYSGGVAAVRKGSYWMLINRDGDILVSLEGKEGDSPFKFMTGGYIVYGVYDETLGKTLYGLLNTNGEIVLKPQFLSIGLFN